MPGKSALRRTAFAVAVAFVVVAAPAVLAGNGHFIHGVGAVNSAMGGAGVALPEGPIGALYLNPALLTEIEGHDFEFGIELVDSQAAVESTVQTPFGAFSGRTEDETDLSPVPSFAWARGPKDGGNVAFGMAFLGLAGFGTDYPQDSSNPILNPQPAGFGAVYSSYKFLKIPFGVGWRVNDELSLGFSFNAGAATLEARPFGGVAPDCSGPTTCFFPGLNEDSAFGFGATVGLLWKPSDVWAFGVAYNTEMSFDAFDWNTTHANPNLPNFGTARSDEFTVDTPQTFTAGLAFTPNPRWRVAFDGRWINYEDTEGFESGFNPMTGAAAGLGWDDIYVFALGVEFAATPNVTLRGGWNRSDAAVSESSAFQNVASPALFEDHLTLGLGWQAYEELQVNLGYYHVFENDVTGAFVGPFGPVPGTSVTNEIAVDSYLATFSFDF
ncbi:MAG TPA: outer membrane protein transport protein [Thermoanaerobaculia bacterium]|nr:outer membrane protein transport protein [Thermoanaerobaculia bacterium]